MTRLAIFWIAGALISGCATPVPNPWDGFDSDTSQATGPVDCGSFPLPSSFDGEAIVYDKAGVNDLEAYRLCAEANEDLVREHAQQIGQLKVAKTALVEAGQAQRQVADLRKEILEEERRHWFWERLSYWAGFIVIGAATTL